MRGKGIVIAFLLLILVLAIAYGSRMLHRGSGQLCQACQRPLHAHSRTVGILGTTREVFCCPACALTAHRQSGQAIRLVELTDYAGDVKLSPDTAWLVRDSDVNLCARQHVLLDESKHPSDAHFDRCSPSILAFAKRNAAEAFIARHGGTLLRYPELAAAFAR